MNAETKQYVAFAGDEIIARGEITEVVRRCKTRLDGGEESRIALYDDANGRAIDIDYSGGAAEVLARLGDHPILGENARKPPADPPEQTGENPRGRGRPKLGVIAREVTLLPRHWDWLADQRGGASAVLRKLVEMARKEGAGDEQVRKSVEAAHRFMWDIAGDQPGFEDASRALFAKDFDTFVERIGDWPTGVREQLMRLFERAREIRLQATTPEKILEGF